MDNVLEVTRLHTHMIPTHHFNVTHQFMLLSPNNSITAVTSSKTYQRGAAEATSRAPSRMTRGSRCGLEVAGLEAVATAAGGR